MGRSRGHPGPSEPGRVPARSGIWRLTVPTPGRANEAQSLASPAGLRINEWKAAGSGPDWLELYNAAGLPVALAGLCLTDDPANPTRWRLPELSFVGSGGFVQFLADGEWGANHAGFELNASGDRILLLTTNGASRLDEVAFGVQVAGASEGRLPDGGERIPTFPSGGSPGSPNALDLEDMIVSEVLAQAEFPMEPAVEIQNVGSSTLNLGGWWLSDDPAWPRKHALPSGARLAPGGFLVVYADAWRSKGRPIQLDAARGGTILLSAADEWGGLTGERVSLAYPPVEPGASFGVCSTSQGSAFAALAFPTLVLLGSPWGILLAKPK